MLDFLKIEVRKNKKNDRWDLYPNFMIMKSNDLMIKGGDFYAIWIEEAKTWSTDEQDAIQLIDKEILNFMTEHGYTRDAGYYPLFMHDSSSGVIDRWHKYCQKQMRDSYVMLDETLIFANTETKKENYASKKLSYPLEPGDISAWDQLLSVLYSPEERHKIEWCIGSVVTGESKVIQKFAVLYGAAGTGKSTVLNIIQKLFDGYCSVFDAKALGSANSPFALEAFRSNPRVAIQHDGDLSRIEDNTRINSIVSHECMTVNEKFKATYTNRFSCFLFMGTNKPVRITDAKSGLIRRLIDISPTGEKIPAREYKKIMNMIDFELGAIAWHCKEVYEDAPEFYDSYTPTSMMSASNDFYNYILDSYSVFERENGTTLKAAWEMYNEYCASARVPYPMSQRSFKEELKNYFEEYHDRITLEDGSRPRSYYQGFLTDKFQSEEPPIPETKHVEENPPDWLRLTAQESLFDKACAECLAQYANEKGTPKTYWAEASTYLKQLDTRLLHYVMVPDAHIVIDFDLRGSDGEKSLDLNLKAASKWPKTYAEVSKSGKGVHLHYLYSGDVTKLSRVYDDGIEIKVFTGGSTLRRMLTVCNNVPIATISSGLPLKEEKKVVGSDIIKSEKSLRKLIIRNLNKEIHPGTKPSVEFIKSILDKVYNNGLHYDVSDLYSRVLAFAANSTNHAEYCVGLIPLMKWKSEEPSEWKDNAERDIVFYDTEVFPNLFVLVWKRAGKDQYYHKMINPTPTDIANFINDKTDKIDFNGRNYDRHILWARMLGYSLHDLHVLSQKIVNGEPGCKFGEAYNIGYTDIYDFASAGNKTSLKQLEIRMGIHHQELGLPWDQDVPEELWEKVTDYCCNDVMATEEAFYYLRSDWMAREILADLADGSVNDTTNMLTTKFIFGSNRNPQKEFFWRDMSKPVMQLPDDALAFLKEACPQMMAKRHGPAQSLLPYFPGYKYEYGKSTYRGDVAGEGGYVYSEPGIYWKVALLDVSSMHPHSAIAEIIFGVRFTKRFREIVEGRVSIKHEAWEEVNSMLDGKLTPYIEKVKSGEITSDDLANALKTAINSVYGLTAAKFDNAFRDRRNIDNIVAKRGALFMIDLKNAVQELGYTVAHIKTDSIKIPNATPEVVKFVMDFGQSYGYNFELEAMYDRMCLVNDAVYIAKYATVEECIEQYGEELVMASRDTCKKNKKKGGTWTATGKQFQVPYVFKTLFSKETIEFEDLCETMQVKTAIYLDMNEASGWTEESAKKTESQIKSLKNKINKLRDKWDKFGAHLPDDEYNSFVFGLSDTSNPHPKYHELLNDQKLYMDYASEIKKLEASGSDERNHDRKFVGKVGQFCPIVSGAGGGILVRESTDKNGDKKYGAVTGSKGYRWLESEMVKNLHMEDKIDRSFYNKLVDAAVEEIEKYGDFEAFIADAPDISGVYPFTSAEDVDACPFLVR